MNVSYILEENKKLLDQIAAHQETNYISHIPEIRHSLATPSEPCIYQSNIDHDLFHKEAYQLQTSLENYFSIAKSINTLLINNDEQIRKKFWDVALILAGNTTLENSIKHSKFPELSSYQKQKRKDKYNFLHKILTKNNDTEEHKQNEHLMLTDIELITNHEYYLYGLRLLRNLLLEINSSKLTADV